jgi:hypothetical protein
MCAQPIGLMCNPSVLIILLFFKNINASLDNSVGYDDMNLPFVQIQSASNAHVRLPS